MSLENATRISNAFLNVRVIIFFVSVRSMANAFSSSSLSQSLSSTAQPRRILRGQHPIVSALLIQEQEWSKESKKCQQHSQNQTQQQIRLMPVNAHVNVIENQDTFLTALQPRPSFQEFQTNRGQIVDPRFNIPYTSKFHGLLQFSKWEQIYRQINQYRAFIRLTIKVYC